MKNYSFLFIAFYLMANLAACSNQNISGFRDVIISDEKKAGMLSQSVQDYYRGMYWGGNEQMARYLSADIRGLEMSRVSKLRKKQRFVDFEVDDISFDASGDEATSIVSIRYYKVPTYLIESRTEQQKWEYVNMRTGWLVNKVEVLEEHGVQGATDTRRSRGSL